MVKKSAMILILVVGVLAACTTAAPKPTPQAVSSPVLPATVAPLTPTPEVFNPLKPSPTPSSSALPLTCQVTDRNLVSWKNLEARSLR